MPIYELTYKIKEKGSANPMGMSASQARLLSITTRLTNNEFESQMISNSKMRLANETQAASDEYMKALNSTKLEYVYYDANGKQTTYDLTASTILHYQPLKNQYALVNRAGQTMVNHNDATTFQQAKHRDEFLVLNNCAKMIEKEIVDPDWLADWKSREPKEEDYTRQEEINTETNELYEAFMREASSCYRYTKEDNKNCYMHVLASMLGPGEHTTSTGEKFTVESKDSGWHWSWDRHPMPTVSAGIHDAMCCSEPGCPHAGKSVYQAAVDLLWKAHFTHTDGDPYGGVRDTPEEEALAQEFFHLIDHDLKQAKKEIITVFDEEAFKAAHEAWLNEDPQMKTITDIEITDPEKAEWYTNLWYRMNGAIFDEELMELASSPDYNLADELHAKYFEKTEDNKQSWVEFDEILINSQEWLKFALESGEITLERIQFNKDYDTTTENVNKTWTAVVWSSTSDIIEVEDELAITKAEVKYEQALRDIQAKDKKYDSEIKKLDTEHNALQTEYDSIKGVMDKNVERSFKAFS